MTLDAIDEKIIRHLRLDGRMSNANLAEAIGLSPSACLRRVKALEHRGIINGYTAIVSSPGEDGIVAIVRITLERQTEDYLKRFETAVRAHPEIEECYLMTGDADYLIKMSARNALAYESIHKDILSRLPGVARINSSVAMRSVLGARPRTV